MTEAYPLKWPEGWPRTSVYGRKWGTFAKGLEPDRSSRLLEEELRRLKASHVVISTNRRPRGMSQVPGIDPVRDPGVAVYFQWNGKAMAMAQDTFDSVAKNLRSLTIAIESMRAIERHGGGYMMQRSFEGFAALPPPEGVKGYEKRPWRSDLDLDHDWFRATPSALQKVLAENRYKELARIAHPDSGGSAEAMAELNVAIEDARSELG